MRTVIIIRLLQHSCIVLRIDLVCYDFERFLGGDSRVKLAGALSIGMEFQKGFPVRSTQLLRVRVRAALDVDAEALEGFRQDSFRALSPSIWL